jgi:site-specific recombinase XerC
VVRKLSELQWGYVIESAYIMANENDKYERTLFIMNALYGMYLRISELTATARWYPKMGDFERDNDALWWFRTVGKGNKERKIAVSAAMLKTLKRWRKHLGLPQLPSPGESAPLIPKQLGKGAVTSTRPIRVLVQECFNHAILGVMG